MTTITFDTLKFVETLKEAGMPEKQAKAISSAVKEAHETAELATKPDVREVEKTLQHEISDLRKDIETLRKDVKTDIRELELRLDGEMKLLKWMMGLLLAGVASLILKAFF